MKREIPAEVWFVAAFVLGGLGILFGALSIFPLAKQAPTGPMIGFSVGFFLAAIAGAFVAERLLRRGQRRQTEQNKQNLQQAWSQGVKRVFIKPGTITFRDYREDLGLLLSTSPPYKDAVADLQRQLAAITERLEKQKNEIVEVQKIDPVLEATLKGSIENLVKRIETLEKKQLEKWDVALVCAQVIGGGMFIITAVSGVVFVVVKYFLGK